MPGPARRARHRVDVTQVSLFTLNHRSQQGLLSSDYVYYVQSEGLTNNYEDVEAFAGFVCLPLAQEGSWMSQGVQLAAGPGVRWQPRT